MNAPPFFIVGHPRSGTTLLAAMMDRHPEVAVPPETEVLTPRVRRPLEAAIRAGRPPQDPIARGVFEALGIDAAEFWRSGPPQDLKSLTTELLEAYRKGCGKPRVGEKTPLHLRHADTLLRWFPHSRMICVVRDGRDAIASAMKLPHHRQPAVWHAVNWLRDSRAARRLAASRPDRFRCVRFEDLVGEPAAVLPALCEFIGVEFDPTQLDHTRATGVRLANEAWKVGVETPVNAGRAFAWRREQPADVAALWTCYVAGELREWGYPACDLPRNLSRLDRWAANWRLRRMWLFRSCGRTLLRVSGRA